MTQDERPRPDTGDPLDARLRALPLEITPARDLWPGIAARLDAGGTVPRPAARRPAWLLQAAAAVVLVAGSSLLTASLLDRREPAVQPAATVAAPATATPGAASVLPVAFGPAGNLDTEYLAARERLTNMLEERIATLPVSARAKLEFNLAEMRRAADEINAALAEQPGDPLLEELLLKTYQDELAVLSNVNELTNSLARTPAAPGEKRIQL